MRNALAAPALLLLTLAIGPAARAAPASPAPQPPSLRFSLALDRTNVRQGDTLRVLVRVTDDTAEPVFFTPATTLRVRSQGTPAADARDLSLVDDTFLTRTVFVLPQRSADVWGSPTTWWTSKSLEIDWDQGWYELQYCTPIDQRTYCSKEVKLFVDEKIGE